MQVRAVDFVLISASDVARSVTFYRDILGLKEGECYPPEWYEFDAGNTTIALGAPPPDAPQPPYNGGITIALAVPDAKAAVEEVRAKGVPVLMEVFESRVCFSALIADPDDNRIWLHQRKDGTAG